jgi:hypothetical protein
MKNREILEEIEDICRDFELKVQREFRKENQQAIINATGTTNDLFRRVFFLWKRVGLAIGVSKEHMLKLFVSLLEKEDV